MKLPLHQIRLFLIVSITLIGLFLFHQKSIIAKTPVVPTVVPVTNLIHVSNSSTCIRDPDIQFFMYHYIRFNDPNDAKSTQDLSVDPRDFETQLSYVRKQADTNQITLMLGNDFSSSVKNGCFP